MEKGEKKRFHFYSCWCCFYVYICISLYLSYCFHSSAGKKRSIISFLKWFRSLHHSALEYICNFFPLFTLCSRIEAHWNANAITAISIHLSCSHYFSWLLKCAHVSITRELKGMTQQRNAKKRNEMKWNKEVFYNRRDYTATIFSKHTRTIIISGMTYAASCEFREPIALDWMTSCAYAMNAPLCILRLWHARLSGN